MLNNINLLGIGHINVYIVFGDHGEIFQQFLDYKEALKYYEFVKEQYIDSNVYLTQLEQKVIKDSSKD